MKEPKEGKHYSVPNVEFIWTYWTKDLRPRRRTFQRDSHPGRLQVSSSQKVRKWTILVAGKSGQRRVTGISLPVETPQVVHLRDPSNVKLANVVV